MERRKRPLFFGQLADDHSKASHQAGCFLLSNGNNASSHHYYCQLLFTSLHPFPLSRPFLFVLFLLTRAATPLSRGIGAGNFHWCGYIRTEPEHTKVKICTMGEF
uniref:Uncharacterized protein n=1 Tax=Trypanosoma vivax (strain Y486) TaxID=1055687 RepID=G0TYM1_TRYVY|nr:hypothetical protein, unlikely [Trypanosoma vivax Y486]